MKLRTFPGERIENSLSSFQGMCMPSCIIDGVTWLIAFVRWHTIKDPSDSSFPRDNLYSQRSLGGVMFWGCVTGVQIKSGSSKRINVDKRFADITGAMLVHFDLFWFVQHRKQGDKTTLIGCDERIVSLPFGRHWRNLCIFNTWPFRLKRVAKLFFIVNRETLPTAF